MTKIFCIEFGLLIIRSLHVKFELNYANGLWEKYVLIYWCDSNMSDLAWKVKGNPWPLKLIYSLSLSRFSISRKNNYFRFWLLKQFSTIKKLYDGWSDFRLYDGSNLKIYLLMRWYGPDALVVVGPTRVYLLDFFCSSIQLYVLLSYFICFYLFFISWFICFLGDNTLIR